MVVFKDPEIRREWLQYLASEMPGEDEADAKQVFTLEDHEASNPEELSFSRGDVIHVLGEAVDGNISMLLFLAPFEYNWL